MTQPLGDLPAGYVPLAPLFDWPSEWLEAWPCELPLVVYRHAGGGTVTLTPVVVYCVPQHVDDALWAVYARLTNPVDADMTPSPGFAWTIHALAEAVHDGRVTLACLRLVQSGGHAALVALVGAIGLVSPGAQEP